MGVSLNTLFGAVVLTDKFSFVNNSANFEDSPSEF